MPKKKKSKSVEEGHTIKDENKGKSRLKYEILSKINDLEMLAKKAAMTENYDEAIKFSENIIRLGILGDFSQHIKDQQDFLKGIALKVHKDYTTKEINDVGRGIRKIYGVLIDAEKFEEAHIILQDFAQNYSDVPYFKSIPLIRDLFKKDTLLYMKYKMSLENLDQVSEKEFGNEFKDELRDIKDLLKRV